MSITEIIEIENNRKESNQFGVIHLLKEGNFYRAHDWSAWLMTMFPIGEAVNSPLKVSAKKLKDGYIEAWVGFPVTSMGKYIPNDDSISFSPVDDNQIDVILTLPEEYQNADYDSLRNAVDEWKNQLPLNDGKKQKREEREVSEVAPRFTRMTDIVGSILSFPLYEKSPMDAWNFVRQLQQQATKMF